MAGELSSALGEERMLGKSDCDTATTTPRSSTDRGGLASFKRANPWLADVDALLYTLIYKGRQKVAEFAGGGIGWLEARLQRLRTEAD